MPRAVAQAEQAEVEVLSPSEGRMEVQVRKEELDDGIVRLHITVPQASVSQVWEAAIADKLANPKASLPSKKPVRAVCTWQLSATLLHVL